MKNRAERTSDAPTLQQRLKGLCDALLSSTTVGACQAVYFLLGLPYVECSRRFIDVNIQPRHQLSVAVITDVDILSQLGPNQPIYKRGSIMSQAGRRNMYAAFCNQQLPLMPVPKRWRGGLIYRRHNHVSFAAFLANYHYWKPRGSLHQQKYGHQPPALTLAGSTMRIVPQKDDPLNLSRKFTLKLSEESVAIEQQSVGHEYVLVYHPHLKVDYGDESKCWALLLMHLPWNSQGEDGLLVHPLDGEPNFQTAVEAVKYYLKAGLPKAVGFPAYVGPALKEQLAYQERREQDADERRVRRDEEDASWARQDQDGDGIASRQLFSENDYMHVEDGYDSDDAFPHENEGLPDDDVDVNATYVYANTSTVRHDMSRQTWQLYKSFIDKENRAYITTQERTNERRGATGNATT